MADRPLYLLAWCLVRLIQSLPLTWVAQLGRGLGLLAYGLDARHRRMAQKNLAAALGGDLAADDVRRLARENLMRLGENYCCAIKTASMTPNEVLSRVEFVGTGALRTYRQEHPTGSAIGAVGHFGNFEMYAHMGRVIQQFPTAATYRSLRQPGLNRLMRELRETSGCRFFERRSEASQLKAQLSQGGLLLGLLADQHAGDGGVPLPFFGRTCSTNPAPAIFALRYHAPLFVAICYRVGLARWRVEVSPFIPTHHEGKPRSVEDIMLEVNQEYERAIRRDPANWFWVHNRWKDMKSNRWHRQPPSAALEQSAAQETPPPG